MSLRSDIIGWVIRRLSEIDAADGAARETLFRALRAEIKAGGYGGAPPEHCLPHLESALAMQEVYWLRESPGQSSPPSEALPKPQKKKPAAARPWQWPKRISVPSRPPGPPPGEPVGPFADHLYEDVTIAVPGGSCVLRLGWTYDPACVLTADCPDIGFSFKTRAASFFHAVDHLAAVLACAKLELPTALRGFDL